MKPIKIERRGAGQARRKRQGVPLYERAGFWTFAKYAVLTLAGILLFRAGQLNALTERGYEAVGGEVFALFIPAFYFIVSRMVRDVNTDKNDDFKKL